MKKWLSRFVIIPLLAVMVIPMLGCPAAQNILVLAYAFRKAEHEYMTGPFAQAQITSSKTQQEINAAEGTYDSAYNCMFSAYDHASQGLAPGTAVTIKLVDFSPCAVNAWGAAYQIITAVRVFDPNFLNKSITYNVNGNTVTYDPTYFSTNLPPSSLPPAPAAGFGTAK
jgi:hypothetical protein